MSEIQHGHEQYGHPQSGELSVSASKGVETPEQIRGKEETKKGLLNVEAPKEQIFREGRENDQELVEGKKEQKGFSKAEQLLALDEGFLRPVERGAMTPEQAAKEMTAHLKSLVDEESATRFEISDLMVTLLEEENNRATFLQQKEASEMETKGEERRLQVVRATMQELKGYLQ